MAYGGGTDEQPGTGDRGLSGATATHEFKGMANYQVRISSLLAAMIAYWRGTPGMPGYWPTCWR
jgi:hypothetical protein